MMAKISRSYLSSLPTQGVILFIVIVVLTAAAIGIPAIWLIHGQLDRQAWELASQGSRMVGVLLDARRNELSNLAILTAQRPTLSEFLELNDSEKLASYLETLRIGADLNLIMICDSQGKLVNQVGLQIPPPACQPVSANTFYQPPARSGGPGWLLAFQPVLNKPTYIVAVGQAIDRDFSNQLRTQIEMEHLLFFNDEPIGGSFIDNTQTWETIVSQPSKSIQPADQPVSERFYLDGIQFYTIRSRYAETGLESMVLLPDTVIGETRQQLTRTAAFGILSIVLFSSVLAILLTKRISLPLERLRDSALALRKGDLVSPVLTNTKVREIAEVTYALEDARIALRHSLEELRQEKAWGDYLLESVVEGVVTIDRQARITFFSLGAERITGWRQEQVLGKDIDEVFLLTDRESVFRQRIPTPGAKPEIVTIRVNNRTLTLAVSGARLAPPEAGRSKLAISIRDISNEEAMRGLLGDFLANITHEFRTPLTALAVSIELLLDQLPDLNQDEIKELLISNHLGILSLQNLIDNLLEGASIEAGRFQVTTRPTELSEVIHDVARVMQPLIEKNHLQLHVDLPVDLPLVQIDPRRTSQVLVNLLSNAIKWGPQGSEILLRATATADEVRVSVIDQGPGIMPEQRQYLFTRFRYRQSDNGRAEYGAGLGLSVVKAIVESQKGKVGAEDRQGGGAIFWFTIPTVDLYSSEKEDL
jgi:PAS domain S-box-containing protein